MTETAPPDEPWALDYPHRDDLWAAKNLATKDPTPANIERAQISAAYQLEKMVRLFYHGGQHTGVIRSRRAFVENASTAWDMHHIWTAGPPSPEAQRLIDRALFYLGGALAKGLGFYEWDRPGYDDITPDFKRLLALAVDAAPPVEELQYEEKGAWVDIYDRPAPRPGRFPRPRVPPNIDRWASLVAAVGMLFALIFLVTGKSMIRGCRSGPPPKPTTCADDMSEARKSLVAARKSQRDAYESAADASARSLEPPPSLAILDEAMEALEAGDFARAEARVNAVRSPDNIDLTLLSVELFLLGTKCRVAPDGRALPK